MIITDKLIQCIMQQFQFSKYIKSYIYWNIFNINLKELLPIYLLFCISNNLINRLTSSYDNCCYGINFSIVIKLQVLRIVYTHNPTQGMTAKLNQRILLDHFLR